MDNKAWLNDIRAGMKLIVEGCCGNKSFSDCAICPLDKYCDAIQLGAEAGLNVDIPENWDYDSI